MLKIYRNIFIITIAFVLSFSNAYAKNNVKMVADVNDAFTLKYTELPDEISFTTTEAQTVPDVISIPAGSTVTLQVLKAQRELRWHKSGIILCKLISYTPESTNIPLNVEDKDIYTVVRKHEPLNKFEATLTGAEIIVMQGASLFVPGLDIGYYFIKGAILKEKDPNWFKAGVHNAYDNSICWFWLKGKDIELEQGNQVKIKDITKSKAESLSSKIDERNERFEYQAAKRLAKLDNKSLKRNTKNAKKMVSCQITEDILKDIMIERTSIAESKNP